VNHALVAQISQGSVGLSNEESRRLFEEFAVRARRLPGVTASAVSVGLPFSLSWGATLSAPGRELPKVEQNPFQYAVTPGYFDALRIRKLSGRAFTDADREGTEAVAIVNETMARLYWPQQSPIGACIKFGADSMPCTTVIGVVSNTRRQDLVEGLVPQIYRPLAQLSPSVTNSTVSFFGFTLVVGTTGDASALVEPLRRTIQSTTTSVPYANVMTMRGLLGRQTRSWELGARVFSAFGVLALALAAVGLFSVVAFTIGQRMHEFGIRTALGAQAGGSGAIDAHPRRGAGGHGNIRGRGAGTAWRTVCRRVAVQRLAAGSDGARAVECRAVRVCGAGEPRPGYAGVSGGSDDCFES
jgi:hypothetical protein